MMLSVCRASCKKGLGFIPDSDNNVHERRLRAITRCAYAATEGIRLWLTLPWGRRTLGAIARSSDFATEGVGGSLAIERCIHGSYTRNHNGRTLLECLELRRAVLHEVNC